MSWLEVGQLGRPMGTLGPLGRRQDKYGSFGLGGAVGRAGCHAYLYDLQADSVKLHDEAMRNDSTTAPGTKVQLLRLQDRLATCAPFPESVWYEYGSWDASPVVQARVLEALSACEQTIATEARARPLLATARSPEEARAIMTRAAVAPSAPAPSAPAPLTGGGRLGTNAETLRAQVEAQRRGEDWRAVVGTPSAPASGPLFDRSNYAGYRQGPTYYVAPSAAQPPVGPPPAYLRAPTGADQDQAARDAALARVMAAQEERRRAAYQMTASGPPLPPPNAQGVYTDRPALSMQPGGGLPSLDSRVTWGIVLGAGALVVLLVARR